MPALGDATQPSSQIGTAAGAMFLQRVQSAVAQTLNSIQGWSSCPDANWAEQIYVIYSDNSGAPDVLLGQSAAFFTAPESMSQRSANLITPVSLSSGAYYWIGAQIEHDATYVAREDSGGLDTYSYYGTFNTIPSDLTGTGAVASGSRFGFSGTTTSGAVINTYPATVRSGSTGNAYTTTGLTSVTAISIGTLAATSISDTTGDGTHSVPSLVDGVAHELYGTKTVTITGTGGAPTTTTNFQPATGNEFVTLSGTLNTSNTGGLYNFSPAAVVTDQIVFPDTANFNYDAQGNITGEAGTYNCWHIQASTKIARSYSVTLSGGVIVSITPLGGVTSSGNVKVSTTKVIKPLGGVTSAGDSLIKRVFASKSIGGVSTTGAGRVSTSLSYLIKAIGGIGTSGAAALKKTFSIKPSTLPSLTVSGASKFQLLIGAVTYTIRGIGGMTSSGVGSTSKTSGYVIKALGGVLSSGSALVVRGYQILSSGAISLSGAAKQLSLRNLFGSGGAMVSGGAVQGSSLDYTASSDRIASVGELGMSIFRTLKKKTMTIKDPDNVLDYGWDFSSELIKVNDTIQSTTVIVSGGVSYSRLTNDDYQVTAFISGGVVGTEASATFRINTVGGRVIDKTLYFTIKQQ
jgi:hypothetical protein